MDFPLLEICDDELGEAWAEKYFHGGRLKCPKCGTSKRQAWIEGSWGQAAWGITAFVVKPAQVSPFKLRDLCG